MYKCSIAVFLFVAIFYVKLVRAQAKTDKLLTSILSSNKNEIFQQVLREKDTYRFQLIYTQINRDKDNRPSFKNYYYNYNPNLYFNPASMVKLPLAFLALEKLNELKVKGVNKYTTIQYDSSYPGQKTAYTDSTSETGFPSIAHYIKRAFLISENEPYNRLYQFLGQQEINRKLHKKGYSDARITRQFMGFSEEQNRHTNPVRFSDSSGNVLYNQPGAYNTDSFDYSHIIKLGKAHFDQKDSLINEPFDFTKHNNLSLLDFQQILQSVLFPSSVPPKQRFRLTNEDRNFLLQYLSQYPSETNYPKYDSSHFYNSYVKFFFKDSLNEIPKSVRIFNKVGWAYGFLTDVSYVVDFKNRVEFMLAATVYVNSDEVLNDNKYDFDNIGAPFMYQLGQTIYNYELHRSRLHKPDLSKFKMKYEHRDPADTRATIRDVDN